MNLTVKGKTFALIAFLSALFSYLIITFYFFPHFGMAFSLATFALLSYKLKSNKTKLTKTYLKFTLLFCLFLFIRSEPFITFLNLSATLFMGSLMLLSDKLEKFSLMENILSPIIFTVGSIFSKSDYKFKLKGNKKNKKGLTTIEIVTGTIVSFFVLALVLPLLSSANPFFEKLTNNVFNFLNLKYLLDLIGIETLTAWIMRFVFFLVFLLFIPKFLTFMNLKKEISLPTYFRTGSISLIIPKVVLATILLIFFVTQIQFYFASSEVLNSLGISNSSHTKEVFTQLTVVAGIVFLLIYNNKGKSKLGKKLTILLTVEGIFLVLMAYKSDFEYMRAFGYTYKRLYGLAFGSWILGTFLLFINSLFKKIPGNIFTQNLIIFSALVLLAVNLANFDYMIYNLRKAKTGEGIDYTFLSTLSSDSLSYKDQFDTLEKYSYEETMKLDEYSNKNPLVILWKIEHLQKKYEKFDLRTFNLLDYIQYRKIKEIDTSELRDFYQKQKPQETGGDKQ